MVSLYICIFLSFDTCIEGESSLCIFLSFYTKEGRQMKARDTNHNAPELTGGIQTWSKRVHKKK